MQEQEPKGRISVGGKISRTNLVKFQLAYPEQQDGQIVYLRYINTTINEEQFRVEEMQKEQQYYTVQLNLRENCIYKFQYEVFNMKTQKSEKELEFRKFLYVEKEKNQIDYWNKVWCLYRILPKTEDIFQAYQVSIKNTQNGNYYELKKSKYLFPAKDYYEIMDNNLVMKFRQFSIKQKSDGKEDLSDQIEVQNINKYKMNCIYVEFDLQLFQKEKVEQMKCFMKDYERNKEWYQHNELKSLQQQNQSLNSKLLEQEENNNQLLKKLQQEKKNCDDLKQQINNSNQFYRNEVKNLIFNFEQEKSNTNIKFQEEKQNLIEEFQVQTEQLSQQLANLNKQNLQIQGDFNQIQQYSSQKFTGYIDKIEQLEKELQLKELQLIQIQNNQNDIQNPQSDDFVINLCGFDEKLSINEISQVNLLKEQIQQFIIGQDEMKIKNLEIESELSKKNRSEKGLRNKIQEQIQKQNICVETLKNTQQQLQDYIQQNQNLKQEGLFQEENIKRLKILLEKIKKKCFDLEAYKQQYKELFQKYEMQAEQISQLKSEQEDDNLKFEQLKEDNQKLVQQIVLENEKQIKMIQNDNYEKLEKQKSQIQIEYQLQNQRFIEFLKDIFVNLQNQILMPYLDHQQILSQNISCSLDNETKHISILMLTNVENQVNNALEGINFITNRSFNNLKIDLIQIQSQIIEQIHLQKKSTNQQSLKLLLTLIKEFQDKLKEIEEFTQQNKNMVEIEFQSQIQFINFYSKNLDQLLDIIITQRNILQNKNDELEIFSQNYNNVTQAFHQINKKSLDQLKGYLKIMDEDLKS